MKIFNKLKIIILFLLVAYCYSLAASSVNAATLSLGIDPSIIEINAIPPTTINSPISIQNKGDGEISLQIELKSFKAKGENGSLIYLKENSEIFKNIQILDSDIPVESLTLEPKQQKNLILKITIPQDANISDYYFSVIFTSTNAHQVKSNSSTNHVGIATNVLLSIGQLETPKAILEQFSSGIFFEKGPVPLTIRLKNQGNHFIRPTGYITIKNMFDQNIGKLNLINTNVLSDSVRAIPNDIYMQTLRSTDSATTSILDFNKPISLWSEDFLLGLYSATLNISLSDNGPLITKTIHFLAFPFQGLIIIVIIAIAATVTITRVKQNMNKNRTRI